MAQNKRGTGRRRKGQGSNWIRKSTRFAIYDRDGFACVYCATGSEDGVELTLDHVVPCELGGSNAAANLVTACYSCNSAKGHRSPRAWYGYLRALGVDTSRLSRYVRRQLSKPLNRDRGRRLITMRRET